MKQIKKIARICNNDHNWKYPSRRELKSSNPDTYENLYGFGFEEWLFDGEKVINGYHYAFLQPINAKKHIGQKYQIHLYYRTPYAKGYVGYIDNVECLTLEQAEKCLNVYSE
ncbi:MAG: hypothetical protein II793_06415, partial [Bacteroidales bacterium]|nr:hypothetical protein [Bacteroidales bacterium]